jgi:hypothetical protein
MESVMSLLHSFKCIFHVVLSFHSTLAQILCEVKRVSWNESQKMIFINDHSKAVARNPFLILFNRGAEEAWLHSQLSHDHFVQLVVSLRFFPQTLRLRSASWAYPERITKGTWKQTRRKEHKTCQATPCTCCTAWQILLRLTSMVSPSRERSQKLGSSSVIRWIRALCLPHSSYNLPTLTVSEAVEM